MRVWIDITNSLHVVFFRPLINLLEEDGHEVEVTAREYAQTLELLRLHGIAHHVVGPRHGGAGVLGKMRALAGRLPALRRFGKNGRFDVALAHGSHELTLAARSLGIPSATAHDYEFATLQHQLGLAATHAVFPTRFRRSASPGSVRSHRSCGAIRVSRRSTTWPTSSPTAPCSTGSTPRRCSRSSALPRRSRSTTDRATRSSVRCSNDSAATRASTRSCSPEQEQRAAIRALGLPSLHITDHAVDAQSLVALADLVVSAGGTMNREAAALGVPVYTTFAGCLGAVDEQLLREERLALLNDVAALPVRKRDASAKPRVRRDPRVLLEMMVG